MARAGRPTPNIELSDSERETLQRWVRRHSSAQALAQRSRIVLACAEGATNGEVAASPSGCIRPRCRSGAAASPPTASKGSAMRPVRGGADHRR